MFAMPDPASLIQISWKPEIVRIAADRYLHGKPVEQAPRQVLKRQLAAAEAAGYRSHLPRFDPRAWDLREPTQAFSRTLSQLHTVIAAISLTCSTRVRQRGLCGPAESQAARERGRCHRRLRTAQNGPHPCR
jgi:hypothetical protein